VEHFYQFTGSDIGQIAESFMFSLMIKSLYFRSAYLQVQESQAEDDTPGLVYEITKFIKSIFFFDNIYAEPQVGTSIQLANEPLASEAASLEDSEVNQGEAELSLDQVEL